MAFNAKTATKKNVEVGTNFAENVKKLASFGIFAAFLAKEGVV